MSRKHSIDMRHNILQLSMVGVIILTVIGIVALTPFVRIVFYFFEKSILASSHSTHLYSSSRMY